MKIICSADWHFRFYDDNKYDKNGIPLRVNELLSCLKQMCEYGLNNEITEIFLLGDINDQKYKIDARCFVLLKNLLNEYADKGCIFHIIAGNHDMVTSSDSNVTAVDLLEGNDNIIIYREFTTIFKNMDIVPYSNHLKSDIKNAKGNDILLSHFSVSSAALSNGQELSSGEFSLNDLKKYKRILLGDIHIPSNVGKNVTYCGSPIQFTRAEAGEDKRFIVFDNETFEIESVLFTGYRKYRNIVINKDDDIEKITDELKVIKESSDDYIVVRNNLANIPASIKKELDNVVVIDQYEPDNQQRGITTGMDIVEQANKYLEINNIEDKNKYIKIFKQVFNKM